MKSLGGTISAAVYLSIADRAKDVDAVRKELQLIVNAQPTQICPEDRASFVSAILADLSNTTSAPWTVWPSDLHLLALTAIKTLSRNPVGSEGLCSPTNYPILCFHSGLPFPSSSSASMPSFTSEVAKEAMKVLANLGVQLERGRECLAQEGGARAIAKALAGKDAGGKKVVHEEDEEDTERLFLLGRLGFVVTINRREAVKVMVDEEGIIDNLVYYMTATPVTPANFNAFDDLLKFTNNIIRFYPFSHPSCSSDRTAVAEWDHRFDDLLWATLYLFYSIPSTDLAPPLSHCLHVLLSIPWTERLLPTWHAVPDYSALSPTGVRSMMDRLGGMWVSPSGSRRPSAEDAAGLAIGDNSDRPKGSASSASSSKKRRKQLSARKEDPTAFSVRVVKILNTILDRWLPFMTRPDDVSSDDGMTMDEHLPPIFLLLARAAGGSVLSREYLKNLLLPPDLDRSPAAGPLEKRPGLLGTLLRFMACTSHPQCKLSAGEVLWAVCGGDPSTFNAEIGYGNAAGFLVFKGMSGVPEGKIEEIEDEPKMAATLGKSSKKDESRHRHPITALDDVPSSEPSLSEMTDDEKEREAERLFGVFERMDRNPVISAQAPDGSKQSVKDALRAKYVESEAEFERKDKEARREAEKRDEEEAMRDYRAYLDRKGKK